MTSSNDPDLDRTVALSRTMVELADTLVHDFDVVEFLQMLSSRCVNLLELSSAGVMLQDPAGNLQVMASSDERGGALELMDLQREEGPGLDAYRVSRPIQAGAAEAARRWPMFAERARAHGYLMVGAVPLRLRDQTIGALNMFRSHEVHLDVVDIRKAQALADIATIGLLNERALREARLVAEQLQDALTSRVVIEQAKGVIAVRLECSVDDAFSVLRAHARSHNLRLGDVARDVIEGRLDAAALTLPKSL